MNKVNANPAVGYTQDEEFDIPEDFNPCATRSYEAPVVESKGLDDLFN